jgi:hypothetical protein
VLALRVLTEIFRRTETLRGCENADLNICCQMLARHNTETGSIESNIFVNLHFVRTTCYRRDHDRHILNLAS